MQYRDEFYMQRCFDLARLGAGSVSPNPMVGAVLVHEDRIIGEGWHQRYGQAHAEVNAVNSVLPENRALIAQSTLYVSLEPCTIFGKTPPCTNLILQNKIPKVVISCLDQTPEVAGKGVALLRANGVEVVTGVLESEGKAISRFRNHFVTHQRPYVILKFAQTRNGKMGKAGEQVWISNAYSKRLVHRWRSEVDAILIGTNTARVDNPALTNRLYFGKSPLRIVIDRSLQLPANLHLFDGKTKTLVIHDLYPFNPSTQETQGASNKKQKTKNRKLSNRKPPTSNLNTATSHIEHLSLDFSTDFLFQLLSQLHERKITTLLVEGGATLLEHFIQNNVWDEARVLIGNQILADGIAAPFISGEIIQQFSLEDDQIICYQNVHRR